MGNSTRPKKSDVVQWLALIATILAIAIPLVVLAVRLGRLRTRVDALEAGYPVTVASNVPVGTILAWDQVRREDDGTPTGERWPIPDGWVPCDGSNGTPNLIGRFLRGSRVSGETGGNLQTSTGERDSGTDLNKHKHQLPFNNKDGVGHAVVGAPFGPGIKSGLRDSTPYLQGHGVKTDEPWKLSDSVFEDDLNKHTHSLEILPEFYSVIYIMRVK